jgi:predicted ABC-type ATPase
VWIINPDLLTRKLVVQEELEPGDANLQAVQRIERWLNTSIDVHQTIGVETVLSTPKYRKLVQRAKSRGFEIRLIYVLVESVEIQIERVKVRVRKGGHDVPEHKIRERRVRSLAQLRWFFDQADRAIVLDNSASEPRLIVERAEGIIRVSDRVLPEVAAALDLPA